jgi:hypothetical protein
LKNITPSKRHLNSTTFEKSPVHPASPLGASFNMAAFPALTPILSGQGRGAHSSGETMAEIWSFFTPLN